MFGRWSSKTIKYPSDRFQQVVGTIMITICDSQNDNLVNDNFVRTTTDVKLTDDFFIQTSPTSSMTQKCHFISHIPPGLDWSVRTFGRK